MRDFKRMQSDPPEGVNGAPLDNDIMKWHAVIFGCAFFSVVEREEAGLLFCVCVCAAVACTQQQSLPPRVLFFTRVQAG